LEATTVIVKLRWSDFSTVTRRRRLPAAIDAEEDLRLYSVALLRANWRAGGRVRLVGVGVTGLSDAGPRQLGLGWDR
jgi:DNA polymerase-4